MDKPLMKGSDLLDICTSLLLFVLVFSYASSFVPLSDARSSFSLGSTYNVLAFEVEKCAIVAGFIRSLATLRQWEKAENYYGSPTTVIRIFSCAGGAGDTYAISFYVGHGNRTWYQNGVHYFILADDGSLAYDYGVYSYTSRKRTKFAFLWSCYQAEVIGGFYDGTSMGPFGMPHGWLHTTTLSPDGYANPDGRGYAFIGWNGTVKYLTDFVYGAEEAGYNFLLHFYNYALYYRHRLRTALDEASRSVWGGYVQSFADSPFYIGIAIPPPPAWEITKMMVYGDGNLVLP